MGLVLDYSVIVLAERQELPVSMLLDRLQKQRAVTEIVLSAISVVEPEHGIHRGHSPQQAARRRRYLETVFAAILTEPLPATSAKSPRKSMPRPASKGW